MFDLFLNRSNAVFAVEFVFESVIDLFCNRSNAIAIVIVFVITLGDWLLLLLLLLLLFSSTLGAAAAVSNTLGVVTGGPVTSLVGGENILVNCSMASLTTVPVCTYGVAGCSAWRMATRSSVALANLSVVDVVGMSTFSGKNSNVFVVLTPFVSGM